jgi:hypothetical protein
MDIRDILAVVILIAEVLDILALLAAALVAHKTLLLELLAEIRIKALAAAVRAAAMIQAALAKLVGLVVLQAVRLREEPLGRFQALGGLGLLALDLVAVVVAVAALALPWAVMGEPVALVGFLAAVVEVAAGL